jgi:hypothetical protein
MGQHVRTDYPDGYSVQQSLNALGQPVRLQDGTGAVLASNIAYFPSGETAALTYGNGIVRGVTENARQLTSRIVDGGMVDLNYSYDATETSARSAMPYAATPGRSAWATIA